tara:strand:- start:52 stop:672 length:621 start_codon:yes stop_codon:yes gene_type:complete
MRPHALIPVTLLSLALPAHAGVLVDYGSDYAALNDAGVIRSEDNPNNQFGFEQFQLFSIDAAEQAWRIDRVTVHVRAWNTISTGEGSLAIYRASGLEPDLAQKVSGDFVFSTDSLIGEAVRLDLGGVVLESGTYFVGIEAAEPTAELLWLAGDETAFRTARRSDGAFFSGSPRSLSLSISGEVIPAPPGSALLMGAGVLIARRRRN